MSHHLPEASKSENSLLTAEFVFLLPASRITAYSSAGNGVAIHFDFTGIIVSRFLFGVITGVIMMYVASHYHVVRGQDGFYLVPKLTHNLQEIYVDTRDFSPQDWLDHEAVAAAILQSNQTHLLGESTLNPLQESVQNIFSNFVPNR